MRLILLENLTAGMILAKTIYASDGTILLAKGADLRPQYIQRLKNLEIGSLYIEDDISQGIDVQDVIHEATRMDAVNAVRSIVSNSTLGKTVNGAQAKAYANKIVDDLFHAKDVLINMTDLRTKSDYTFCHMVNVAVLSIVTGVALGYDELKLRDLGVGALLHDLGKVKIDEDIYNKPDRLTDEEFAEIKTHSEQGFEILRKVSEISTLSAHVAFQHHERFDGTGYPRNLKGQDIHEFARIVALADVYDALTASRPYRKAMMPYHAVEYLTAMAGSQFDPVLTEKFIDHIAVYPAGSIVELNTLQKAIVVSVDKVTKTRPLVRVFMDEHGKRLEKLIDVDLRSKPTLFINRVVEE